MAEQHIDGGGNRADATIPQLLRERLAIRADIVAKADQVRHREITDAAMGDRAAPGQGTIMPRMLKLAQAAS